MVVSFDVKGRTVKRHDGVLGTCRPFSLLNIFTKRVLLFDFLYAVRVFFGRILWVNVVTM